ncbi:MULTISPECIES: glutathione transferase GstA [Rhodopseudomonas]|uniref:Glutathione S-transferase n=1 Tax=Rhodopseudomonas palustris TaxID=1076 RepID=A0A0D7EWV4_RHOPL|nr:MULTISPECIES: glutathione transferase GstA [Rhodopseudomonas]KIZ45273.1 glutathione S-transferase [Rhodopseudomonas palustris]MDF3811012.1 glutathione transferase GstA [Rhodopseudomonas sp. BAL398]WOK15910.1 glutathione transferase GstA [Rhodopseudomonas sp. BAL398]
MKLYLAPHACSLAVDIVARELKVPLTLEWVDVRAKKNPDGSDYFAINPKGQVPTLQLDDGQLLTEGTVIVQCLADMQPANSLLPKSFDLARYRVLEWLSFVSAELHKGFTPLFRPTTPPAYREVAIENLSKRFGWLNEVLTSRPYLTGDEFTVADAYCYTIVTWNRIHHIDLSPWPRLVDYIGRIETRDSVKAAREAEAAELRRRSA